MALEEHRDVLTIGTRQVSVGSDKDSQREDEVLVRGCCPIGEAIGSDQPATYILICASGNSQLA